MKAKTYNAQELAAYQAANPIPPTKVFSAQLRAAMLAEKMPGAIPSQRTLDRVCKQTEIAERMADAINAHWRRLR